MRVPAILCLASFGACGSSAPPPASGPPPPVGTAQCQAFAETVVKNCKNDRAASFKVCDEQARFAEAGGCIAQAQRSYDCSMEQIRGCSTDACCDTGIDKCDPLDRALENCLRGYCTGHAGNPDCAIFFEMPTAPK